jgi:hypothetical protein
MSCPAASSKLDVYIHVGVLLASSTHALILTAAHLDVRVDACMWAVRQYTYTYVRSVCMYVEYVCMKYVCM